MLWRLLANILLIILLTILQLSFWQTLPWDLPWLDFITVIGVFVLIIFDFKWACLWWLLPAWLIDLFGFWPFGLGIVVAAVNLLVIYWLLVNFFTNRSLYATLFLVGLAALIHSLGLQFAQLLTNSFLVAGDWSGWWLIEGKKLAASLILGLIGFYLLNFLSFRFRPVFLKK